MKIECIYPEFTYKFAEQATIEILKRTCDTVITHVDEEPKFISDQDIKMVLVPPFDKAHFNKIVERLSNYKSDIEKSISRILWVVLADSIDIFSKNITYFGKEFTGLSILDVDIKTTGFELVKQKASYKWEKIVGLHNKFREYKIYNDKEYEEIISDSSKVVGFKYSRLKAIDMYGPLLLQNPSYLKMLLNDNEFEVKELAFEENLKEIYVKRSLN